MVVEDGGWGRRVPPEGVSAIMDWKRYWGMPSSSGDQFSLSESLPDGDVRMEILVVLSSFVALLFSLPVDCMLSFEEVVLLFWRRGAAVDQRASLGFFALPSRCPSLLMGALRLALELGCKGALGCDAGPGWIEPPVALVDRIRLIWAMADPLLSYLAWAIKGSSWLSASQQNSQAWTSRERPRVSLGGKGPAAVGTDRDPVRAEIGGRVTDD